MSKVKSVLALREQGWPLCRIAQELGIHRQTVARYVALHSKSTQAPTGSESPKSTQAPTGSDDPKSTEAPTGSGDRKSTEAPPASESGSESGCAGRSVCEPLREAIEAKVDQGLHARRIFQDLTDEHGFQGSYWSVMRFVRRLGKPRQLPFRRMECGPGEEAQVDFGSGAPVLTPEGRRRRTHVFRIVLSHSRKAYSEAVFRQTTEEFLRCIENAFVHFGGSTKTLVIDNLRAAVTKADWYEPELHPKLRSFAEYYGVVILPNRPYTPRHKGKVESGVKYVKRNALQGRQFPSLEQQNAFLRHWESSIADTRIHGTTKQQVGRLFEDVERAALTPIPVERFPCFHERQHTVHRDGHVQVDGAFYSVPPEYFRQQVWVRWDGRMVRVFNQRMEEIRVHVKQQTPGRFSTHPSDIASEKIHGIERGTEWLLRRAGMIGRHADRWAQEVIRSRGIEGIRAVMGLINLADRQSCGVIDKACEIALGYGVYRLKSIRQLIDRQAPKQEQMEFIQEHPIIRNISVYGELVKSALGQPTPTWRREDAAKLTSPND
ncbi:MAG: IS21 family transposase [Thermoguttaceae bacterium]|nr:IS21 family transposase [Thermoguttaceae bacterium]